MCTVYVRNTAISRKVVQQNRAQYQKVLWGIKGVSARYGKTAQTNVFMPALFLLEKHLERQSTPNSFYL